MKRNKIKGLVVLYYPSHALVAVPACCVLLLCSSVVLFELLCERVGSQKTWSILPFTANLDQILDLPKWEF